MNRKFIELHSADKYNTKETYFFDSTSIEGVIKTEKNDYAIVIVGGRNYCVKEDYSDIISKIA